LVQRFSDSWRERGKAVFSITALWFLMALTTAKTTKIPLLRRRHVVKKFAGRPF
jgi:hypothetical protein